MDHSDTWYLSTIDDMHNIHASTSQYKIQLNTWILLILIDNEVM